jgi:hypothetical protein
MVTALILVSILAWLLSGFAGFVFWWTHDYPLTREHLPIGMGVSLVGPFTWLIGWVIHGN